MALRRLQNKITKENLWIYILNLLKDGPLYAYEVREKIREKFGFEPATITVYMVLYKLEREGLVIKEKLNEGPRKYYSLTEKGIKTLEEGINLLRRTLNLLEE
ncbi:MAG: PadR family transcriptional regulator [Candidatus Methanomethyliaceae archaeon]|nr:PadR family transcriptional regulator [Candidatus Methanomethyliaceae archaeon]